MEEGIVLLTALCAVDFGHLVRHGCLSDYLPSAAASRSEAASSCRASLWKMAVAVGRLLEHQHIGFHTVGEVMPVAHYIMSLPFLQTRF